MVPRNGYTAKSKDNRNIIIRLPVAVAKWFIRKFSAFVKFFKDLGLEDAEHRLVMELASLTEKDELVWVFCDEGLEVFFSSRNGIPFRLEIGRSGPVLLTGHEDVRVRLIKGAILDILVQLIFKQEARMQKREEIAKFDPNEEFRTMLMERYREFEKRRPK